MLSRVLLPSVLLSLVVSLTAQQAAAVPFETANQRAAMPRWLSLKFGEFDTTGPAPTLPADLVAAPTGADYHIVQLARATDEPQKAALRSRGVELLDYVPNHAWIVRATEAQLQQCAADGLTVWSSPLHPAYRIDPALLVAEGERRVAVLGFAGTDLATLRAQIAATGAGIVEEAAQMDRWLVVATASPAQLRALAKSRDVQWVEAAAVLSWRNDTSSWAVQTGISGNRRIWTAGLHGENQVIGHMDGQIASTSCYFSDPVNPIGPAHRKLVYFAGTTGVDAHGTHTGGTAAGDAFPVSGSVTARGMAYAAKLAHTNNFTTAGWSSVATTHRSVGARLHTNSWGDDTTTAYNAHCNAIDAFSWANEDSLVFFAETNLSTLKNPENAKNLVAVGNAQNGLAYGSKGGGGVGPTADGRRKPDLFAPGTSIVSASTGACGTASMTGTSMACPCATGAGALVRQYFVDGFYPSGVASAADSFVPSGALVKAVLVNTCQDMTGVAAAIPNTTEGWGHIVLDESLHFAGDTGRLWVADVRRANGLVTAQQRDYTIDVVSALRPLEVTLAFTDFAGTVNAANPVVDNLNLVVVAPGGATYLGNVWSGGWSTTGGTADAINNVERFAIQVPATGTWTFRVVGALVPQGPCGFALCATGDLAGGFALAAVANYGLGKPGTIGVPTITGPLPTLPSTWNLNGSLTVGNAFGIVVFGDAPVALPFDGGTVLANPLILNLVTTGTFPGPWSFPVALPNSSSLNGVSTYWQFWMPNDPAAAGEHWAASPGLRMTMGN